MYMQSLSPAQSGRSWPPFKAMAGTCLPAEMRRSTRCTFIIPAPSCCSHTDGGTHEAPLRSLQRRAVLPPARVLAKYNHRGIDLQHLFLGMTAEGHCTAGLEMGAQCVSPVKYLLQFTEGHFFPSGNVICDLINKYINKDKKELSVE